MNLDSAESMLQSQIPAKGSVNESTKMALEDAVLSPRFYTTLKRWIALALTPCAQSGMH